MTIVLRRVANLELNNLQTFLTGANPVRPLPELMALDVVLKYYTSKDMMQIARGIFDPEKRVCK